MKRVQWHFPRTELAERIYTMLASGPIQGVSMFGPRRIGKTQFLIHDLAPFVEKKRHRVVYANLWQVLDSPLGVLLYELDAALRGKSLLDRMSSAAGALAPKFTLAAPGGGKVEIDLANLSGKAPDDHLLLLDQYCERLANSKRPTFLLLDEFQDVARSKGAEPLVAALRTSLDKRRDGLVAVFTGSSQVGLRAMFSARKAPFFRFATPVDLPPLDAAFVDHQLRIFAKVSKVKLRKTAALGVFERFGRNPQFFQKWLMAIGGTPDLSAEEAVTLVEAEIAEEFGFAQRWRSLSAIQRVTARLLAEQVDQIYGKEGATRIRALTGRKPPAPSKIQSALARLSRLGLADKFDDDWRLGDPLFEMWVRGRPTTDF